MKFTSVIQKVTPQFPPPHLVTLARTSLCDNDDEVATNHR